ncbi:uncharacterized protein LOC109813405 [Cajanus cajan]|uniref:uncharacterized protein LOC109813405 n=1 Tax=Cajanus cajan TaxID=3821 RepID=UPI00098DD071|nr:uncharacterized protein LOC109813405 [Cajanus cajan]
MESMLQLGIYINSVAWDYVSTLLPTTILLQIEPHGPHKLLVQQFSSKFLTMDEERLSICHLSDHCGIQAPTVILQQGLVCVLYLGVVGYVSVRELFYNVRICISATSPPHFHAAQDKPSSSPSLTFSHTISEKLDTKNYLLWCQQVEPVIKGHRLHHFLVNPQIPPKFLSIFDRDANRISEAYLAWEQQDQLLLSWLQSSMSKDMLTRVIGCKSSFQIWDKIHAYFHAHTNAKARQLRGDLRGTTLDNRSISDYLLCIQTLVDALTAIGNPVSPKEHLDIVLEGLLEEYESTVSLISNRFDELTIEEVETLLLAHESRLEKFKKKNPSLSIFLKSPRALIPPPYHRKPTSPIKTLNFPPLVVADLVRGMVVVDDPTIATDMGVAGLLALNAKSAIDTATLHLLAITGPRPLNPTSSQAYLVSTGDHQAQASPMAMTAFSPGSNLWYPDSGASNHVTNMSHNIQQFTPFEGPDQIIIRNGQGLPINSSGVAAFPSPLKPHISLTLNNLIYVPNITKNLISVSQFCKDNSVFFEFHSTCCLVKSQDTKDTLLMGVVGPDGLYQFPSLLRPRQQSVITPSANTTSCNSVPYATWHSRLGHPHNDVMKSVFRLCNFPIMNKTVSDFCTPCCLGKSHKLPSTLSKTVYHTPFELIYSDLWGPAPITSDNGYQYYVTFVDAHTRFT